MLVRGFVVIVFNVVWGYCWSGSSWRGWGSSDGGEGGGCRRGGVLGTSVSVLMLMFIFLVDVAWDAQFPG